MDPQRPAAQSPQRWASARVGVWSFELDALTLPQARDAVRCVSEAGYGSLFFAEGVRSREALTHAAMLLDADPQLVIGTGIANIWARDPVAMSSAARTLGEAFPDRFVLGMGVSHVGALARRGHVAGPTPMAHLREYVAAMDAADLSQPVPAAAVPRLLAALRERMLGLAGEIAQGAHTYFVPVEHTVRARRILGPGPLLVVEQAAVMNAAPAKAREIARHHTAHYLQRDNYRNNLRWLGFSEQELAGSGSDAVVDALVVHGRSDEIAERVRAHFAAGADHVLIQLLGSEPGFPARELAALAPVLTAI
jgi:probable F420-dependent oxidoreductase